MAIKDNFILINAHDKYIIYNLVQIIVDLMQKTFDYAPQKSQKTHSLPSFGRSRS